MIKLKKPHKYTHLNIELLKASNSEKMDHNIEWGKLYFLIASSKGLAVIILMKLHHFFSLFLCPFYVFVQKGSSQCTFLVNFSSQFTFLVNYSFTVYVLVNFSSVYVWVNFQYAWFNSFQLFTHSKNSLQYQFDNSHSVLIIARGFLGISVYKAISIQWHKIESSVYGEWNGYCFSQKTFQLLFHYKNPAFGWFLR